MPIEGAVLFELRYIMSILSNKTLFGFKILFVIGPISLSKIRNRPSKIHCLNSDGTGDLSLLRYKPDFVTSLFVINELCCRSVSLYLSYNIK